MGGLAIGFALPFNTTALGFGTGAAGGTTVANNFFIGGDNITNVFTGTNTNNDGDTITITNTNNGGRRRRSNDFFEPFEPIQYLNELFEAALAVMGTTKSTFLQDYFRSVLTIYPFEVMNGMSTLSRKMQCLKSRNDRECEDFVVCEHLSEDHLIYDKNMLMRMGELFVAMLNKYLTGTGNAYDVITLMEVASHEECETLGKCNQTLVSECQDIT